MYGREFVSGGYILRVTPGISGKLSFVDKSCAYIRERGKNDTWVKGSPVMTVNTNVDENENVQTVWFVGTKEESAVFSTESLEEAEKESDKK